MRQYDEKPMVGVSEDVEDDAPDLEFDYTEENDFWEADAFLDEDSSSESETERVSADAYTLECVQAQEEFCKENRLPMFIPHDGICFRCGQSIFVKGRTKEQAASDLLTGCPHCHISYCD